MVHLMQYLGYTYTKNLSIMYLKFKLHICILSGSPTQGKHLLLTTHYLFPFLS